MKVYSIHCGYYAVNAEASEEMALIEKVQVGTTLPDIGNCLSLQFNDKETLNLAISILHKHGIPIYGFKRKGLFEKEYRKLTRDELCPNIIRYNVVTLANGTKKIKILG